jgi:hypothetical protein
MMVKFRFPTDNGNDLLKGGRMDKILPQIMEDLKPEAAYFYPEEGLRAGHFIVQVDDSSQILEIGERLWLGLGGDVEMVPVMAPEDLQKLFPRSRESFLGTARVGFLYAAGRV